MPKKQFRSEEDIDSYLPCRKKRKCMREETDDVTNVLADCFEKLEIVYANV